MSTTTSPKKGSLLGLGTPRNSPFRRPESPSLGLNRSSSINTDRTTPTKGSPAEPNSPSPTKTPRPSYKEQLSVSPAPSVQSAIFSPQPKLSSIPKESTKNGRVDTPTRSTNVVAGDPLSKLNATQLREMRESFQVLDRDNDGQVTREDVADMLNQLGLDSSPKSLAPYFPSSTSNTMNLNGYLQMLSTLLTDLSRSDELEAAFSAFDTDDSGQIDIAELKKALMHVPVGIDGKMNEREIDEVLQAFTARRTFKKGGAGLERGMVFRYGDFVAELHGGTKNKEQEHGVAVG